jgi:hypothetical protein
MNPRFALALSPVVFAASLLAQDPSTEAPAPESLNRPALFTLRVGLYTLPDIQTKLRVDYKDLLGTDIDFKDTLGGEDSISLARTDLAWQFANRHRVNLSWFDISLEGQRELKIPIIVGDESYEVGANIKSNLRTNVIKLDYGYTFYAGEKTRATVTLGAHVVDFDFTIGPREKTSTSVEKSFNTVAPLPVFGLEFSRRLSDKWKIVAAGQAFALTLDDEQIDGNFFDAYAAAEYQAWKHVALGAGVNHFSIDAKFGDDDFLYDLRHKYTGILLYGAVTW